MNRSLLRLHLVAGMVLLLSACWGPKTPQQVTQAFWTAVINGDAEDAVAYSTLADTRHYDGFSKEWRDFQPSWGKVIIDGNQASVVSKFASPANSGMEDRNFVTYLVRHDEQWQVDYERTAMALRGGALGVLFGTFSKLGDELSQQFEASADDFNTEMERMSGELETLSEQFEQQAAESIERYSEALRHSIRELEESINRALREDDGSLSDEDKRVLIEVSTELDENSRDLAAPSVASVASSSENIGAARLRLDALDSEALESYRKQWRKLSEKFEQDLQKILDDL